MNNEFLKMQKLAEIITENEQPVKDESKISDLKRRFRDLSTANLVLSPKEIDLILAFTDMFINKATKGSTEAALQAAMDIYSRRTTNIDEASIVDKTKAAFGVELKTPEQFDTKAIDGKQLTPDQKEVQNKEWFIKEELQHLSLNENKMKKQILSEEFKRMQKLAGIITENQINEEAVSPEKAVDSVSKIADKIENDPKIDAFAASIASDPKKKQELLDLSKKLGINPLNLNENIEDPNEKLALMFAKKAKSEINEYGDNEDVTTQAMGALSGLFAGAWLAPYLAEKLQMFTHTYINAWGQTLNNPDAWVPFAGMAAGAIAGWVLGEIIKKVF